jgi:hypothetical protein
MNQDEQYLNLLSIFHYVVGSLTALFSCAFLIHIVIGIAMLVSDSRGQNHHPRFLAWFIILFPSVAILAGWTLSGFIIAAGRRLKRRTSYTFCLVMAGIECIFMPFGTVLGIFTIITLMKEPVKKLFSVNQAVGTTY